MLLNLNVKATKIQHIFVVLQSLPDVCLRNLNKQKENKCVFKRAQTPPPPKGGESEALESVSSLWIVDCG